MTRPAMSRPVRNSLPSLQAEVFVLLISSGFVAARAQQLQQTQTKLHAPWVTCYDKTGEHFVGPKTERTAVLTSPNDRRRAYAEISAAFSGATDCENTARLYVSADKSAFQSIFTELPSQENGNANSLGPVAWSADSRWLLVERGYGAYGSDYGGIDLLLYDAQADKISTPNALDAVSRRAGKKCVLGYNSFIGFDARNRIVFRAFDWRDDNGRESYCIAGVAEWAYDPASGVAKLLRRRSH